MQWWTQDLIKVVADCLTNLEPPEAPPPFGKGYSGGPPPETFYKFVPQKHLANLNLNHETRFGLLRKPATEKEKN